MNHHEIMLAADRAGLTPVMEMFEDEVFNFARLITKEVGKQEPIAWLSTDCIGERYLCFTKPNDNDLVQPLYFHPKHDWIRLTDEERLVILREHGFGRALISGTLFMLDVETKLKEKNQNANR